LEKFGIAAIPSKPAFSSVLNMINGEKAGVVIFEIMRENFELLDLLTELPPAEASGLYSD
jgi:hypothetical protein